MCMHLSASGCTDIQTPLNTYQERDEDSLIIHCHQTDQSWTLKCIKTQWIGSFGNCSIPTSRFCEALGQITYHELIPLLHSTDHYYFLQKHLK